MKPGVVRLVVNIIGTLKLALAEHDRGTRSYKAVV
jgi:hypothetical protein